MSDYLYREGLEKEATSEYASLVVDGSKRYYTAYNDGRLRLHGVPDGATKEIKVANNLLYNYRLVMIH